MSFSLPGPLQEGVPDPVEVAAASAKAAKAGPTIAAGRAEVDKVWNHYETYGLKWYVCHTRHSDHQACPPYRIGLTQWIIGRSSKYAWVVAHALKLKKQGKRLLIYHD
ncbi:hypothetical protein B0T11DRAFT_292533 [Plectosphaerella cucumerina]|uniref:Uncharacterized protein n=1 Tax=Plectosphaerella cucumerina TaxID=40658 RepID=A0A8K0TMW6_9PEZI|nr:hypothetical protein B0T11DRAFT_292533 [Plectosphaerella cucumerina]